VDRAAARPHVSFRSHRVAGQNLQSAPQRTGGRQCETDSGRECHGRPHGHWREADESMKVSRMRVPE
jgi:hypothetical protein